MDIDKCDMGALRDNRYEKSRNDRCAAVVEKCLYKLGRTLLRMSSCVERCVLQCLQP